MTLTCEVIWSFLSFRVRSLKLIRAVKFGRSTGGPTKTLVSWGVSWGWELTGSPFLRIALAILSTQWYTFTVWWVFESPGLSFPTQQQYSLASTISITVISHTSCLSQPQGDYFDIISCHRMLRKTILPLVTCPKGKIYNEWHVTDVSYVASFCQLSHLLYCASHIYSWYPASLQLIYFCSKIHCCEVCVCKIKWLQLIYWYY